MTYELFIICKWVVTFLLLWLAYDAVLLICLAIRDTLTVWQCSGFPWWGKAWRASFWFSKNLRDQWRAKRLGYRTRIVRTERGKQG